MCTDGGFFYLVFLAAFQFRYNPHANSIETSILGHLISNNAIPTYKFFRFPLATIDLAFSFGHTAGLLKLKSYHSYYAVLHAHIIHLKLVGAGLHAAHIGGQFGQDWTKLRKLDITHNREIRVQLNGYP